MEGCVRDVRDEGADDFRAEIIGAETAQISPVCFCVTNPIMFSYRLRENRLSAFIRVTFIAWYS